MILSSQGWGRTKPPLGARQNPSHPLSKGLVGHWIMNEGGGATVYDLSGQRLHGAITLGTGGWAKGQFGSAFDFDAANTRITPGTNSFLNTVFLGPLTISAWIFPRTAGETAQGHILAKADTTGGANRTRFWIDNTTPEVDAFSFTRAGSTVLQVTTANSVVTYNAWQHVLVTWTGSVTATTVHIYKNGVELGYQTQTNGASFGENTDSIRIGGFTSTVATFDGIIDDVRFYNRVLNIDEIRELYSDPFCDMAPRRRVFAMGEAAGLTVAVGQVVETDSAQPVAWAPKHRLVNQVSEVSLAQSLTPKKAKEIAQALDTELAQAVAHLKAKAIAQALETDLSQAIAHSKTKGVGQVSEVSLAQSLTARKAREVAQVLEADLAQSVAWAPKHRLVNQVVETDLTQAIARLKTLAVAQALESDVAQTITRVKTLLLGLSSEADLAQALGRLKTQALSQALETNLAQALTSRKTVAVGLVTEFDLAQAIAKLKTAAVGQISETDLAQAIARLKTITLGLTTEIDFAQSVTEPGQIIVAVEQVTEIDFAQAVLWSPKIRQILQTFETDLAQALSVRKQALLSLVSEISLAQSLTAAKAKAIAQALETDLAQTIARLKIRTVEQINELDLAQAISLGAQLIGVSQVTETDLAQSVLWSPKTRLIGQAIETDLAQEIEAIFQDIIALICMEISIRPALSCDVSVSPSLLAEVTIQPAVACETSISPALSMDATIQPALSLDVSIQQCDD